MGTNKEKSKPEKQKSKNNQWAAEVVIILHLLMKGEAYPCEIEDRMGIPRTTATRILQRLVQKGYLEDKFIKVNSRERHCYFLNSKCARELVRHLSDRVWSCLEGKIIKRFGGTPVTKIQEVGDKNHAEELEIIAEEARINELIDETLESQGLRLLYPLLRSSHTSLELFKLSKTVKTYSILESLDRYGFVYHNHNKNEISLTSLKGPDFVYALIDKAELVNKDRWNNDGQDDTKDFFLQRFLLAFPIFVKSGKRVLAFI